MSISIKLKNLCKRLFPGIRKIWSFSDKKGYEDAAQVLHDKVNGEGPHWEIAQAMWQEMSPNRALFEEGVDDELAAEVAAEVAGEVGVFMDIAAEEEGDSEARDGNIIDFNVDSSDAEEGIELDLSIGDDTDESFDILDDTADEGLEIDLSIDEDDGSPDLDIGELEVDSGSGAELDLDLEIQEDEPETDDMDMESTVEMPSLSMEGIGLEIDDDDDTVFVPRASAADEQSDEDEIATKLDLAKAYVELGDGDSAKDILDDVLVDGSDEQKKTAQNLLNQLN
jgi:pilus assembly protein FimV